MSEVRLMRSLPRTKRNVAARQQKKRPEVIAVSRRFGREYFDGPRDYGYGVIQKLRVWLDASIGRIPPESLTGKVLGYLDKQWPKLIRVLDDGRLRIDTNPVENAIRPFVIGRNNWMFADTVHGAQASANLYSIIETAKANGIEPHAYLHHIFTELPKAKTLEAIEELLPHRIDAAQLKGSGKN